MIEKLARALVVIGLVGTIAAPLTSGEARTAPFSKAQALRLFYTKDQADQRYAPGRVTVVESAAVSVEPGEWKLVEADCPAGLTAIGGGGWSDSQNIALTASYPSDGTNTDTVGSRAWGVWGDNDGSTAGSLYAYAVCADVKANF